MIQRNTIQILAAAALTGLTVLSGCSAKVESIPVIGDPVVTVTPLPVPTDAPVVPVNPTPAIDEGEKKEEARKYLPAEVGFAGQWLSQCMGVVPFTYQVQLEIAEDGSYKSIENLYEDEQCAQANGSWREESGRVELVGKSVEIEGAYNLNWIQTLEDGATQTLFDIMLIENGSLFTGEYRGFWESARATTLNRTIEFRQDRVKAEPAPAPTPTPTNEPAPAPTNEPTPAPTNEPAPVEPVEPEQCVNLIGVYQMNMDLFTISQNGCKEMAWTWKSFGGQPDRIETYRFDGQEHEITPVDSKKKVFVRSELTLEQMIVDERAELDDGKKEEREIRYSLSTKPCNLLNPSGTYLVQEVYKAGSVKREKCNYWKKQH